ncbi:MAG TPA: ABC transporter permease [Terriglobales bacterium]|nr:ABC transporter permease [Terriglobales bacterium]
MDELVIEPGRVESQYWKDVWRYRQLFYFLAWRDLLVRYKQTVIGVAWAVLRPLLTMIVFTVVFGKIAKLPTEGNAPYAILVYAAMLPWQFFATSVTESSNSLILNANLVSKIYFPRLIVPAGSVITSLVDFLISFTILVGIMAWYRYWPDWRVMFLPLFIALACAAAIGVGLWLCALNVEYRDFRYVVPFIAQFGLYVSPVGFSSSVIPPKWRLLYSLNPMVGVIDGFRWALLRGQAPMYWAGLLASAAVTAALCLSGTGYFRKMERTFADVI